MYHKTLSDAFLASNIEFGDDFAFLIPGVPYNARIEIVYNGRFISVSRCERGLYESAIVYGTKMENMLRVVAA